MDIFLSSITYDPHPARAFEPADLLSQLRERVDAGLVSERRHLDMPELSIFTYTDRCTYDQAWDLVTLVARGLVMDTATPAIVATPFPKFFNYGEIAALDVLVSQLKTVRDAMEHGPAEMLWIAEAP